MTLLYFLAKICMDTLRMKLIPVSVSAVLLISSKAYCVLLIKNICLRDLRSNMKQLHYFLENKLKQNFKEFKSKVVIKIKQISYQ